MNKKNVLLVEPDFPYPNKSKNKANQIHKNFVPIGLLKFGAYHKSRGDHVNLVRGKATQKQIGFIPDEILVTSLFTYWSSYVWEAIEYYRTLFPKSVIKLGGIYATLHGDTEKFKGLASKYKVRVFKGVVPEIEEYLPDYSLLPPVEYHATHMMRGCIRRCAFCGTWRIEPRLMYKNKDQILKELVDIGKNKVILFDNNLLANPHIKDILISFQDLRVNGKPVIFESQSGFDGRLLERDPELVGLIRRARFSNIRIAWDNGIEDKDSILNQINLLTKVGYVKKDVSVFMIYNFDRPYEEMLEKLKFCGKWGVQITDCRYRPLDWDHDDYNPQSKKEPQNGSYYIHETGGWTDKKIREFRRKVRKHNIWIRYGKDKGKKYNKKMEKWSNIHNTYKFFNLGTPQLIQKIESNRELQELVRGLNRIKAKFKERGIPAPDLSSYSNRSLKEFIKLRTNNYPRKD